MVNKCILHANTHQRIFLRYKHILFITVLRMVKALGISECSNSGLDKELHQWVFHTLLFNVMSILLPT